MIAASSTGWISGSWTGVRAVAAQAAKHQGVHARLRGLCVEAPMLLAGYVSNFEHGGTTAPPPPRAARSSSRRMNDGCSAASVAAVSAIG